MGRSSELSRLSALAIDLELSAPGGAGSDDKGGKKRARLSNYVSVHGDSGVGKSALAAELLHQELSSYSVALWMDCSSPGELAADFSALAAYIGRLF